jgi:hypothetical protein
MVLGMGMAHMTVIRFVRDPSRLYVAKSGEVGEAIV